MRLNFEKAISIGLRSGLYGGRMRNHAPRSLKIAFGFIAFMAGQIVEDDNVAFLQRRRELGLDIELEHLFRHWSVNDPRRGQSIASKSSDEGLGFPMSKRRSPFQSLTMKRPAAVPRHLCRGCGFVDKNQPVDMLAHARLPVQPPTRPGFAHVIASVLRRQKGFFYIGTPSAAEKGKATLDGLSIRPPPRVSQTARAS